MAKIKVIAGDLDAGSWSLMFGQMTIPSTKANIWKGESISLQDQMESLELVDEQNKKRVLGTLGGGVAGAVLLGPLGAIGGLLVGGNGKQVTIACTLKDGRKFLGVTDNKVYQKLLAMTF